MNPIWVLAAALAASVPLALAVRIPEVAEGSSLALMLSVNGPRLLVAASVGMALAASSAIGLTAGPVQRASVREALVLGASFGGASGGVRALDWGLLGPVPDFALGALLGAALFAGILYALSRVPWVSNWLLGAAMVVMAGFAVVAAVGAKGNPDGFRPISWWLLGDFSRATPLSAGSVFVLLVALTVSAAETARDPSRRPRLDTLSALLWGIAIGVGGVIAWFGLLVALAARRLAPAAALPRAISLAALGGAVAMIWADALPRLLVHGFAFPVGIGVAMLAIPWIVGWGPRLGRPEDGRAAVALRVGDYALGGITAIFVAGFVGLLTFVVAVAG